jgi:hypothetical protein
MSPGRERRGNISIYSGLHKKERLLPGLSAVIPCFAGIFLQEHLLEA